jgi:hypothetical protein
MRPKATSLASAPNPVIASYDHCDNHNNKRERERKRKRVIVAIMNRDRCLYRGVCRGEQVAELIDGIGCPTPRRERAR